MTLKDLPQTFYPSRTNSSLLFLGSAIIAAIGTWMVIEGSPAGYVVAGLFALISLIFLLQLFPRVFYLKLTAEGFEHASLFKRCSIKWEQIAKIGTYKIKYNHYIGYNLKPATKPHKAQSLAKKVSGYENGLPNSYGFHPIELAELLNRLKDEHLERQH